MSRDSRMGLPPSIDSTMASSRDLSCRMRAIRNRYLPRSAGASLDFTSLINVPVGLVLAGQVISEDPNGESNNNSMGGLVRIAYTGRDDFVIALDLSSLRTTLFSGTTVDIGTTQISMRYYF